MNQTNAPATTATSPYTAQSASTTPPEVSSMRLLGNQGLLRIEHKGAFYMLRATSKGGLILTK